MKHLDMFSGIGGFAIAAKGAGFETIAFCEYEPRCRAFLERTWGLPVHPDIRELDARQYRGRLSLLTGGPPCQPASRAGKQGGESDDRWLWGEAVRVVEEARPDWFVFENPLGILDVGLDGILSDLEALGYEIAPPFDIPACAVDSPQLRHRLWIVGHAECEGREPASEQNSQSDESKQQTPRRANTDGSSLDMADPTEQRRQGQRESRDASDKASSGIGKADQSFNDGASDMADASSQRYQERGMQSGVSGREGCPSQREAIGMGYEDDLADSERIRCDKRSEQQPSQPARHRRTGLAGDSSERNWGRSVWVPCADGKLRRAPDDSIDVVDGLHRSLLGALGNSIVPQVALEILKAIAQVIQEEA